MRTAVCARSLGWHACPLADHEPGQRDEASCGEQFLAQVMLDAVPDLFFGAQALSWAALPVAWRARLKGRPAGASIAGRGQGSGRCAGSWRPA